jgi:hypothetical protein
MDGEWQAGVFIEGTYFVYRIINSFHTFRLIFSKLLELAPFLTAKAPSSENDGTNVYCVCKDQNGVSE